MRIDVADMLLPVCHGCLGESWLKGRVRSAGTAAQCHYCGSQGKCVSLAQLAAWIREVLDRHFQPCKTWSYYGEDDYFCHYRQKGDDLEQIVADMIEAEVPLVDAVVDELTVLPHSANRDDSRLCYDRNTHYAAKQAAAHAFEGELAQFRHELKHRSRSFNANARRFLDRLMQDIRALHGLGKRGHGVIRTVQPDDATLFYRARRADHPDFLGEALSAFKDQLGPPPPEKAPAGRMNAEGVSVFHGALDRETCIAELRPLLGETVVSAAFRLVKPLRLLDFPLLEQCYRQQPLAYFQPDFDERIDCRHILRHLHVKIGQPAPPGDEAECLPTQVFAEYLGSIVKPRIDGVLYSSLQRQGGINVVLFGHVLDIQLGKQRASVMGPNSVLRILDDSAAIHRVQAIDYRIDDAGMKGGDGEWLLDSDPMA